MKANEIMEQLSDSALNIALVSDVTFVNGIVVVLYFLNGFQKEEEDKLKKLNSSIKDEVDSLLMEKSKLSKLSMIEFVKLNIATSERVIVSSLFFTLIFVVIVI